MNPADQIVMLNLEIRLTRQNFARLLDEVADVLDGKVKKQPQYPALLRHLAETQRVIARTTNQ